VDAHYAHRQAGADSGCATADRRVHSLFCRFEQSVHGWHEFSRAKRGVRLSLAHYAHRQARHGLADYLDSTQNGWNAQGGVVVTETPAAVGCCAWKRPSRSQSGLERDVPENSGRRVADRNGLAGGSAPGKGGNAAINTRQSRNRLLCQSPHHPRQSRPCRRRCLQLSCRMCVTTAERCSPRHSIKTFRSSGGQPVASHLSKLSLHYRVVGQSRKTDALSRVHPTCVIESHAMIQLSEAWKG
jgi:hypothetical protein